MTGLKEVMNELREIKKEIHFIKEHIVDIDTILTPEEEKRLDESLHEFKTGRAVPLAEFEKEMNNVRHRSR